MMKTKMRGLKKEGSEALPLFLSAGTLPSLSHRWTEGDIFQQECLGLQHRPFFASYCQKGKHLSMNSRMEVAERKGGKEVLALPGFRRV